MTPGEAGPRFLSAEDEAVLLEIARAAIDSHVRSRVRISLHGFALSPAIRRCHGAFVTLRIGGALRGCVGQSANTRPLADCVRDSAINAAAHDPRFSPLLPNELGAIRIEISALGEGATPDSPFIPLAHMDELRIGRDGLMVREPGGASGLLLPQVAVVRDWDGPTFLDAVCQKAGLNTGAWLEPDVQVFRFTVQSFAETGYTESGIAPEM